MYDCFLYFITEIMCEGACRYCFKDLRGFPEDHAAMLLGVFEWRFLGLFECAQHLLSHIELKQCPNFLADTETIVMCSRQGIVMRLLTLDDYLIDPADTYESYRLYAYNMESTSSN